MNMPTIRTFCGAIISLACLSSAAAQQNPITVVSFGGAYQEAQRKALFQPASKATGIPFQEDTMNSIADIRVQVRAGRVSWDVVAPGGSECVQGASEGLFEPLDFSVIDKTGFPDKLVDSAWIGGDTYSAVIAWSKSKFGDQGPKNWSEFFDTKKFPGRRALYQGPHLTMEAALLADGVPPSQLYPIDVERALKKISTLGDSLAVFWKSGGQSIQLAKDGEVDLLMMYNGRAVSAISDGVKLGYHFDGAILNFSCWAIPKGSRNVAAAQKFIAAMVSPDISANLPRQISYGPVQPKAYEGNRISDDLQRELASSPQNMKKQTLQDNEFWLKNQSTIKARWDKYLQER